jgi:aspartyl aminopeptidase
MQKVLMLFDLASFPSFIGRCPTSYHFVSVARDLLIERGYVQLEEHTQWNEIPPKFFVIRDFRSLTVFTVHDTSRGIFLLSSDNGGGVATKPVTFAATSDLDRIGVRSRGRVHTMSYMDRDLKVAGLALVSRFDGPTYSLFETSSAICVLPHVSEDNDMCAIAGFSSSFAALSSVHSSGLLQSVADAVDCLPEQLVSIDGFLVDAAPPCAIGELLNGQNVDVMTASLVSLFAFIEAGDPDDGFRAFIALDQHQVVCNFLPDVVERLRITKKALGRSQIISIENEPAAGDGIIGYCGTNRRIVTSFDSQVLLVRAAKAAGVPLTFVSEAPGAAVGSAVPVALGVQIALIGIPVMAQGSVRETVAMSDVAALYVMAKQLLVSWARMSAEDVE